MNLIFLIIRWTKHALLGGLLWAATSLVHAGNPQYLYVVDIAKNNLWKIATDGSTHTVIAANAGGDSVTMDPNGNIYVADGSGYIRKVDLNNNNKVTPYFSGLLTDPAYGKPHGWHASSAPFGLTRDLFGNFYFTVYSFLDSNGSFLYDTNHYSGTYKIAPNNTISVWDNQQSPYVDYYTYFVNSDSIGNIYVDDFGGGGYIWEYDQRGISSRTERAFRPSCHGFTFDTNGNMYASCISYAPYSFSYTSNVFYLDPSSVSNALWKIPPGSTNGILINGEFLEHPGAPVFDASGNLYVADDRDIAGSTTGAGAIYKYTSDSTGTNWTRTVVVSCLTNGPSNGQSTNDTNILDTATGLYTPFIQPFYMVISPATPLPGQVTNVLTTTNSSNSSINISWSAPTGLVSGYHIFRSTGTGSTDAFILLNTNSTVTNTNYNDSTAGGGMTYYYKVAAFNDSGTGDASVFPSVSTPTFSPGAGSYVGNQSVTISCATPGATIIYTTDGTTPSTSNGTLYTVPVVLGIGTNTLKAYAYQGGMADSLVASANYAGYQTNTIAFWNFTPPDVAQGTSFFRTPQTATAASANVTVSPLQFSPSVIPLDSGYSASIWNGMFYLNSTPTNTFAAAFAAGQYEYFTIQVNPGYTLNLASVTLNTADGNYSQVPPYSGATSPSGNAYFLSSLTGSTPGTFSASDTSLGSGISGYCWTSYYGAYTLPYPHNYDLTANNGVAGTALQNLTSSNNMVTFRIYMPANGLIAGVQQLILNGTVAVTGPPGYVATPTFSPVGGSYVGNQSVTISCATPNATIIYTTDGTTPGTNNGNVYTAPVAISIGTNTLQAFAYLSGKTNSSVASANYVISQTGPVATPTFSPVGGSYVGNLSVTISSVTQGATIIYTTDGTTPGTNNGTVYATPVAISTGTNNLQAFAYLSGMPNSAVVSATYIVSQNGPVATPTFSPVGGSYIGNLSVTISSVTQGATIIYTTDGTTPGTNHGTTYTAPVVFGIGTNTLRAFAYLSGMTNSSVASATYVISQNIGTQAIAVWDFTTPVGTAGSTVAQPAGYADPHVTVSQLDFGSGAKPYAGNNYNGSFWNGLTFGYGGTGVINLPGALSGNWYETFSVAVPAGYILSLSGATVVAGNGKADQVPPFGSNYFMSSLTGFTNGNQLGSGPSGYIWTTYYPSYKALTTNTYDLSPANPMAGTAFQNLTAASGTNEFRVYMPPNGYFTGIQKLILNGTVMAIGATDLFAAWQLKYFGCTNCPQAQPGADPFGKGISDTNQFLLGLNPTNSASVFRVTSAVMTGNDFALTWQTAGPRTNVVQAAGGLGGSYSSNFQDLTSVVIGVTGDTTTNYTDHGIATNLPARFYRIRLGP